MTLILNARRTGSFRFSQVILKFSLFFSSEIAELSDVTQRHLLIRMAFEKKIAKSKIGKSRGNHWEQMKRANSDAPVQWIWLVLKGRLVTLYWSLEFENIRAQKKNFKKN